MRASSNPVKPHCHSGDTTPKGAPQEAAREQILHVLDVLRTMPAPLRRFLRDFPAHPASAMPRSPRDGDIVTLIDAGFLQSRGVSHRLTALGRLARAEIWGAERYVATHVLCSC